MKKKSIERKIRNRAKNSYIKRMIDSKDEFYGKYEVESGGKRYPTFTLAMAVLPEVLNSDAVFKIVEK